MSEYYFTFQSLTAAQRAAFALTKEGIAVQIVRAPKPLSDYGCSYAIRIPSEFRSKTAQFLFENRIPWERAFYVSTNSRAEEVWF